jgi:hypothetical protein
VDVDLSLSNKADCFTNLRRQLISDVASLKRLNNSEDWLCFLCIEWLRENVAYRLEESISRTIRIVDGTIVREPSAGISHGKYLPKIHVHRLAYGVVRRKSDVPASDWRG